MNIDYEMWMITSHDIRFLAHEYTHRIIEQIAGLNSQIFYKWFDEGLAEYEGIKALSIYDSNKAKIIKEQYFKSANDFYKNGTFTNINNMTTEKQWSEGIMLHQNKYYIQSYVIVNYLIEKYGIKKVKEILEIFSQKNSFNNSFKEIYEISIEEFEKKFFLYLENIKTEKNKKKLKFDFSVDDNVWINIRNLIDDKKDNINVPEADIRLIYAEIFNNELYILFTTESEMNRNDLINYCIVIDINNDENPDFQIGFNSIYTWLWDLTKAGIDSYKDYNNLSYITESEKYFGKTIKFMIPIKYFKDSNEIRINMFTTVNNIQMNRRKNWVKVKN